MKTKLCITVFLLSFAVTFLVYSDSYSAKRIEEIKRQHERTCETSRLGIAAGYMACRMGLNMSNYMAALEKEWAKQLQEQIEKESK